MLKEIFAELTKTYEFCMMEVNEAGCVEICLIDNGAYLESHYWEEWEEDESIEEAIKTIKSNLKPGNVARRIEQFLFAIKNYKGTDLQKLKDKFKLFLTLVKASDKLNVYLNKSTYFEDLDLSSII